MAVVTGSSWAVVGVLLLTAPVSGCAGTAWTSGGACTEMGHPEGVDIDLTAVVDPAAGSHTAQVDLTGLEAPSATAAVAVSGSPSFQEVSVAADLTGEPVTVSLSVHDATGREVYAGEGVATPELFQPNGARCDGEQHALRLSATTDGGLVPRPGGAAEVAGSGDRRPFALHTHCGIDELVLDGAWYERIGGSLDDGSGNPPEGWDNPSQSGVVTVAETTVTFTDDAGHHEVFALRDGATDPERICT